MRIYIAGKYSGIGHANACAKFAHTKLQLIAAGIAETDIVNPMELGIAEYAKWALAIEICLANLKRCDAVFMQYDWRDSDGAKIEEKRAKELGIPVFYETQGGILSISGWYNEHQSVHQLFTATAV